MIEPYIEACERFLGRRSTIFLRWVLLLPVSSAAGLVTFLILNSGYAERFPEGNEIQPLLSLVAAPIAGWTTIYFASTIAPAFVRGVAVSMSALCIVAAGALVWWAYQHEGFRFHFRAWFVGASFALSATVTAISYASKGGPRRDYT